MCVEQNEATDIHLYQMETSGQPYGLDSRGHGSLVAYVGILRYGLCSSLVGVGSYSSLGVNFADNVWSVGTGSPRKEAVLDFQNLSVRLPPRKKMRGVSSFESSFGKGHILLDFENSVVRLPCAEEDLRSNLEVLKLKVNVPLKILE
ncbi:hypothetical protein Tco_0407877 [Tanacetum coccineum]